MNSLGLLSNLSNWWCPFLFISLWLYWRLCQKDLKSQHFCIWKTERDQFINHCRLWAHMDICYLLIFIKVKTVLIQPLLLKTMLELMGNVYGAYFPLSSASGDIGPSSLSIFFWRCPVLVPALVTSPMGPVIKANENSDVTPEIIIGSFKIICLCASSTCWTQWRE